MRKSSLYFLVLLIACMLAGCFSAQQLRNRRIADNPGLFNSFSPAIREQIRRGFIDIGFSQNMVVLAWGRPHRIISRRTREGETTIWEYTRTVLQPRTELMSFPVSVTDERGNTRVVYQDVWFDRGADRVYTVARVEFVRGIVTAIERLN